MRHDLAKRGGNLERTRSRLLQQSPAIKVQTSVGRLQSLHHRLRTTSENALQVRTNRLNIAARGLHSVSPLATLERGYAIVSDKESGQVLSDAGKSHRDQSISARLAEGSIDATVTRVHTGGRNT